MRPIVLSSVYLILSFIQVIILFMKMEYAVRKYVPPILSLQQIIEQIMTSFLEDLTQQLMTIIVIVKWKVFKYLKWS